MFCKLHNTLKARRETLNSRKAAAGFLFYMATASLALSPDVELLLSLLIKLGKVEGALQEINSVLMSRLFDLVAITTTPPRLPLSAPYQRPASGGNHAPSVVARHSRAETEPGACSVVRAAHKVLCSDE